MQTAHTSTNDNQDIPTPPPVPPPVSPPTSPPKQPQLGIRGNKAPSLGVSTWYNLPDDRQTVDITDYQGKVVYLYGFQSWCPGCHRLGFPTLQTLIDHYRDNNQVAFIAVQTVFEGFGTNSASAAKRTADQYRLSIPIGHSGKRGEPSTVMRRYRTGGTPWTVIIDRAGIVRYNDFHITHADAVTLIDSLLQQKQADATGKS